MKTQETPRPASHHLNLQGRTYDASKNETTLLIVNRLRREVERIEGTYPGQAEVMYGLLDVLCHR